MEEDLVDGKNESIEGDSHSYIHLRSVDVSLKATLLSSDFEAIGIEVRPPSGCGSR
jgi:hypothetical protein